MNNDTFDREELIGITHIKLVKSTLAIGGFIIALLFIFSFTNGTSSMPFVMPIVLLAGVLGGFISIQQRLPSIDEEELKSITKNNYSIFLIPLNSGVFAIVLMLMFSGGIIQGELFPKYPEIDISSMDELYYWLKCGFPESGQDMAKLFFWSFVSGFNERFVPQIIRSATNKSTE